MRLVETGTRNRLVHVNRSNARGNVINIINGRPDDIYEFFADRRKVRFRALGRDKIESSDLQDIAQQTDGYFDSARGEDVQLETRLGPDALQKKLLKIAREAQAAEEDSGVNILYLAIGFLSWFEDESSNVVREAPLVLLPIELVRNAQTSTYEGKLREEDLQTNLPLQQRLRDDFGIDLPELEAEQGWCPTAYFAQVNLAIGQRARWRIEPDAIQLGFFSFSKLLMYRDLAIKAWPEGAIANHQLTRGLLFEGFGTDRPTFGPGDRLDEVLPPEKLFHVVDADASQAKVIEEVRSGRNLVVQGPPGTGKSQTITNIIAAAVREGKRVLFLAEKMAALSVVHDRLVKVGLRDVCLELHSRSANKKAVHAELRQTLYQAAAIPRMPDAPNKLREARDRLNSLAAALHSPIGSTGETPYTVLGRQARFIGNGSKPPALDASALTSMTCSEEAQILDVIRRYGALLADGPRGDRHPFEGVRNLDLQPVELARLVTSLENASSAANALARALCEPIVETDATAPITMNSVRPIADLLGRLDGLPAGSAEVAKAVLRAPELTRLANAVEAGAVWRAAQDKASKTFVDLAFLSPIEAMRGGLAAGANSFFARWGGAYRGASLQLAGLVRNKLPKRAAERLHLIDELLSVQSMKARWDEDAAYCDRVLSGAWHRDRSDFAALGSVINWCDRLAHAPVGASFNSMVALAARPDALAAMRGALAKNEISARASIEAVVRTLDLDPGIFGELAIEHVLLEELANRLDGIAAALHLYAHWAEMGRLHTRLVSIGGDLAEKMRSGELDASSAATELSFARAEALWRISLQNSPILREIRMEKRHELVANFAALERQKLADNVTAILASHLAQVPQGAQGEMGIVRGEIGKKTRHLAIRRLFERAGTAVQRIKPVLLMSPISVAQFLPPGALSFDLLIVDEASQVRPEEALGAIARANQIVVVGDQKQLPPSSFFDRLVVEDDDPDSGEDDDEDLLGGGAKAGEMESILSLCEARGLGSRMLQWHYRSRDPSLIAVSNREFYEDGLILPPSPLEKDPAFGLCFTRVDGAYDRGGKRDNRREGEAVVARVAEHARAHPTLSLGIVTFSFAQRNVITEILDYARRSDADLDIFLREGQREDLFVKNIENVQGDERDVILISVGYGPTTPGGRLTSMSFGPVNAEGGERRLNVLFTRARVRCEVFASFDPGDIDVSRSIGAGPRILRRFLEYANNGTLDEKVPVGLPADTPFEEDVAEAIRSFGFLADPQVGSAGFRIDIGVRHQDKPGTYILAVECDGATYHSALWARERDRLRQDVLEHLGWRFHRIWSTDWFYNRFAEVARLREALIAARQATADGIRIQGANRERPTAVEPAVAEPEILEIPPALARQMPPYQRAIFPVASAQEPHEAAVEMLSDLARRIVNCEGPIHADEVARRVAASFGKEKAGSRILAAARHALSHAQAARGDLLLENDFWFTKEQAHMPPVRDRSAETGATLKADYISTREIAAAIQIARDDNAGGCEDDLIRTTARLLGYRRVGPDLQARIASVLS